MAAWLSLAVVDQLLSNNCRRGEMSFFLKPFEELVGGQICDVIVLAPDEALLLRANQVMFDHLFGVYSLNLKEPSTTAR